KHIQPLERVAAVLAQGRGDRPLVEQIDSMRQAIALARDGFDVDPDGAQRPYELPDTAARNLEALGQLLAGPESAGGQKLEQPLPPLTSFRSGTTSFPGGGHRAHRGRNSQRRCALFSVPARMRSMFDRCV